MYLMFNLYLHGMAPITKAIIPMAGLGTRLLPFTKGISKSIMPLVNKSALHHVVDEALLSQISNFCLIINGDEQSSIERYFSPNPILDAILKQKNKYVLIKNK